MKKETYFVLVDRSGTFPMLFPLPQGEKADIEGVIEIHYKKHTQIGAVFFTRPSAKGYEAELLCDFLRGERGIASSWVHSHFKSPLRTELRAHADSPAV